MKTVYETYGELADAMCDGEGILHTINCPGPNGCLDWQKGVRNFAAWLDYIGMKVPVTDGKKGFYEFNRSEDLK